MKLLDKKTVQAEVASQRKIQIDEGMALASKIDKLRQTHGSVEEQYHKFTQKMVEEYQNTVKGLEEGIQAKKKELVEIEEQRQKALEPLDDYRAILEERERNIDLQEETIYQKRASLTLFSTEIDDRNKKVTLEEEKLEEKRIGINKMLDEAIKTSLEAQNTLAKARETETNTLTQLAKKQAKLNEFEEELLIKERELSIKEASLQREQEEIIKTKIQLADQRGTLERALARTKKL